MINDNTSDSDYYDIAGFKCIDVAENMNFCLGSALKYVWRCGSKGSEADAIKDLCKAKDYIDREIKNRLKKINAEESVLPHG